MCYIREFNSKYNSIVNNFIISIFVDEFGFEFAREELTNTNNKNYIINGGNVWMAFNSKNELIGTIAIVKHSDTDAELKKFYVRKDYRGKGISSALYNKAIEFVNQHEFNRIFLDTYYKFETAINFYKKNGFVEFDNHTNENGACFFELILHND